jgi:hypothetical protein
MSVELIDRSQEIQWLYPIRIRVAAFIAPKHSRKRYNAKNGFDNVLNTVFFFSIRAFLSFEACNLQTRLMLLIGEIEANTEYALEPIVYCHKNS